MSGERRFELERPIWKASPKNRAMRVAVIVGIVASLILAISVFSTYFPWPKPALIMIHKIEFRHLADLNTLSIVICNEGDQPAENIDIGGEQLPYYFSRLDGHETALIHDEEIILSKEDCRQLEIRFDGVIEKFIIPWKYPDEQDEEVTSIYPTSVTTVSTSTPARWG